MKIKTLILSISVLFFYRICDAQEGNFSTVSFNSLIKENGPTGYSGWGQGENNAFDLRPNSSNGSAFYINHHYGLSFSAHSFYGGIRFYNQSNSGNPYSEDLGAKMAMSINNGSVGIGTTDTQGDRLAVNGKIRAHEIKVETTNWPDYVFTKSYKLPSLREVEAYIKEKGYLPGIPSEAEVKVRGIDLGEMNAKLLQKIEELTLHLIEKDKEIKSIKSDYQELRKMIIDIKSKKK